MIHQPKCPKRIDSFTEVPFLTESDCKLVHGEEWTKKFMQWMKGQIFLREELDKEIFYWDYENYLGNLETKDK